MKTSKLTEMQKLKIMLLKKALLVISLLSIFMLSFFSLENLNRQLFHHSSPVIEARQLHTNNPNSRHLFKDMNSTARTTHYYEANYTKPNGVTHYIYDQADNILYLHVNAYKMRSLNHIKESKMSPRKKHIALQKADTYNSKAEAYNHGTVHVANENAQEIAHSTHNHQLRLIIRKDTPNTKLAE